MTLSNRPKCLHPHQGLCSPSFSYSKKANVELMLGRKARHTCFKYFAKPKIEPKRVNKSYNHDREVHVCGYMVDGVESKRLRCSLILSLPSNILGMANFLIFAWTFMCQFFYGPSCVPLFFQYIADALIGENFVRDFMVYGT